VLGVLCEIARCPLTSSPLTPIDPAQLERLNTLVAKGALRHVDGAPVEQMVSRALVTPDRRLAYRVDGPVAALLPQLAIAVEPAGPVQEIDPDKRAVQEFYESFGWVREGDQYLDTLAFVDTRPWAMAYLRRCHRRVGRQLPPRGRLLLDAGSGPVHHDECRRYSDGYDLRVCVDLSSRALREAATRLGDRALYVLGDLVHLPFRDDVFDAAVSLHAIYHVPAAEQRAAFEEIHRVLRPGAPGVVVYRWPVRGRVPARRPDPVPGPELYSYSHNHAWFRSQEWPFDADVRIWRSPTGAFLRRLPGLVGRPFAFALYWVEELIPRLTGRLGRFPMIVMRKRS
jgi:SAM-dependent methyltransferase